MSIWDFFSRDAGQARRRELEDAITYFVPPEMRGILGLAAEANPVVSMERAGQDEQTVFAPDVALMDRLAAGGRMASNMAGVLAPAVAGRAVGMPAAQALEEGLLGLSATPEAAAVRGFMADESGALSLGRDRQAVADRLARSAATDGVTLDVAPLTQDENAAQFFGHAGPEVWLDWISASRKGAGAEAMSKLVGEADRTNTLLRLSPDDDGSGKLFDYYSRFGFQRDPAGGDIMERLPSGGLLSKPKRRGGR